MLLYKNTFDNVMTIGFDFPTEDQYYANENEAIVADGITRDPIGISDFSKCTVRYTQILPDPTPSEENVENLAVIVSNTDEEVQKQLG